MKYLLLDNVSFCIYGQGMEPGFNYWLSPDGQRAVSILEIESKVKLFTICVSSARAAFPASNVDEAIYNVSVNLLNSQNEP